MCVCRDGMEEEMAGLNLGDFEFFKILLPGMYEEALVCVLLFADRLGINSLRNVHGIMPRCGEQVIVGELI